MSLNPGEAEREREFILHELAMEVETLWLQAVINASLCEACFAHFPHRAYNAFARNPFVRASPVIYPWGTLCRDCMLTLVASGITTRPCSQLRDRELE